MTALSCGLSASVRAIAASTSSSGEASPDRTSSACALASMLAIAVDTLEDRLEPDRERLLELADAAGCEQHSGHERRPVERVVADRERLGLAAEQHLLMRDQSGEADRVDRLVDVPARLADEVRGALGGPRRRVELAVVVQLDDLALGHVPRGLGGEAHHQHRPDGEVRRHEDVGGPAVAPGILGRGAQVVEVEARGPDDRVGAGVEAGPDVRRGGLRGGEVDDDVGSVEQVGERVERRVGPPGELEVVGTVDGLADGLPILPAAPETTTRIISRRSRRRPRAAR